MSIIHDTLFFSGYGTPGSWSSNQVNVIVAFKTKSAGKNKYTIEYYNSKLIMNHLALRKGVLPGSVP